MFFSTAMCNQGEDFVTKLVKIDPPSLEVNHPSDHDCTRQQRRWDVMEPSLHQASYFALILGMWGNALPYEPQSQDGTRAMKNGFVKRHKHGTLERMEYAMTTFTAVFKKCRQLGL